MREAPVYEPVADFHSPCIDDTAADKFVIHLQNLAAAISECKMQVLLPVEIQVNTAQIVIRSILQFKIPNLLHERIYSAIIISKERFHTMLAKIHATYIAQPKDFVDTFKLCEFNFYHF
ncbi:hypothetical protein BFS16_00595 [Hoylesella timonensis]|uniref:Uncharacterized protein n=1 Tax=Hoylesella timonensis TaxID=386414 RepID=A0A2K0XPD9_9BACT|nr:hypothetical protein BFS16_00595 [Hoylesella timonensis]